MHKKTPGLNSGGFLFYVYAAGMNSKRRCHLNSGKNLGCGVNSVGFWPQHLKFNQNNMLIM
jgi:hypothetical protein